MAGTRRSRRAQDCSWWTPRSAPGGSTSSEPRDEYPAMSQTPALLFERSGSDRVVAGVCGGLAARLGVDATLVRLVFALLGLAGGAGILLYFALWVYDAGRRTWAAAALVAAAAAMLLLALGLSETAVLGATLLVAGLAVVLVRGGSLRPGGSLPVLGVILMMAGAVTFLGRSGASGPFIAPGAVLGALARRQERELRGWLYGSRVADAVTLVDALADAAADVEELHGVRIELAS